MKKTRKKKTAKQTDIKVIAIKTAFKFTFIIKVYTYYI